MGVGRARLRAGTRLAVAHGVLHLKPLAGDSLQSKRYPGTGVLVLVLRPIDAECESEL
jgi:hypothetical protein